MTARVGTLLAERWLDEVLVQGTASGLSADVDVDTISLPAGMTDLAIMEIMLEVTVATTTVTNPELLSSQWFIISADGATVLDVMGHSSSCRFAKVAATRHVSYISPDPLVLWRQGELVAFRMPRFDAGASTYTYVARIKATRVRPIESESRGPVRLVR